MEQSNNRPGLSMAVIRLVCAALLLACTGFYLSGRNADPEDYDIKIIPPGCVESGYSLYTNIETGETDIRDLTEPLGHDLGKEQCVSEGTEVEPARFSRTCRVCGASEIRVEYPEFCIPRLCLNGDLSGIGKRAEVPVTVSAAGETLEYSGYATLKYQGHSSLEYDKKNYTLKLYRDSGRMDKDKITLSHWNSENKYVLKANFMDPSQCRNLVCADIWADMTASRAAVPVGFVGLSNYGAVDGFPVALYLNDTFRGIYTWNLHKDDDLFGMKDGLRQAVMIVNHTDGQEAFFREEAVFSQDSPWEVEYCGTTDSSWAREKLNALIRFVRTSDDETFRRELKDHVDVASAVDYCIAMYALGLQEHCAKDLVLVTYGEREPWIFSMYDMEEAFDNLGPLPVWNGTKWDSGTGSLFWDRFLNLYYPEICGRYAALRQLLLSAENVQGRVEAFTSAIPQVLYQADAGLYGTPVHTPEQTEAINKAINRQILTMDTLFSKEGA